MNNNFEVIARSVIINDDKILLVNEKSDKSYYFLPGGHVEFGETIEEGLKREIKEELGVRIKEFEPLFMVENIFEKKDLKRHEFNHVFKVEPETYEFNITEDHIEFSWHNVSDLQNINLLPEKLKNKLKN